MAKQLERKTVYMPERIARQLDSRAEREKRSVTSVILLIIEEALKKPA